MFAPVEALATATARGLVLSLPSRVLLILRAAFVVTLCAPRASRQTGDGCVRIDCRCQCREQLGPRGLQFGVMRRSQQLQQRFSATREGQHDFAAVRHAARAPYQALPFQAIYQFHRAVMLNQQPLGQHPDRSHPVGGQAFDSQQRLVLLRLDARGAHGVLAEIQEAANFEAKVRERLVINR